MGYPILNDPTKNWWGIHKYNDGVPTEYEQYKFNLQYHLIEFISDGIVVDCMNMEEGIVERS